MTFQEEVEQFKREWASQAPSLIVYTSGSTGTPKQIEVEKTKMANSARQTCDFLGISPRNTTLLCMPLRYIAGKMVVVRSIVCDLQLIVAQPSGHPFADITQQIDFAALTPMQVYNTLQVNLERQRMMQVKNLIIGGGAIDDAISRELRNFPNKVWSTYGMTETLSHIALRRLNGAEASDWYTPFENVKISISEKSTLTIDAPLVCSSHLITNDIVEINKQGQFKVIGRIDNIINSGGIKIQIEEVERKLRPYFNCRFAITSAQDKKFGEIVALIAESGQVVDIQALCGKVLPHYWCPKHIIITKIPLTETNKIDRTRAKEIVNAYISSR